MKILLSLLLAFSSLFFACKKSENNSAPPSLTEEEKKVEGKWSIKGIATNGYNHYYATDFVALGKLDIDFTKNIYSINFIAELKEGINGVPSQIVFSRESSEKFKIVKNNGDIQPTDLTKDVIMLNFPYVYTDEINIIYRNPEIIDTYLFLKLLRK